MPRRTASPESRNVVGTPSMTISPSSGVKRPKSTFIKVDLPAPFSPSSEWI